MSAAQTLPLRAWRDADLVRVAGIVQSACDAWARDWEVSDDTNIACQGAAREMATGNEWRSLGRHGDARAWMRWGAEEDARLAAGWFNVAAASTPVVRDLVAACRTALMQCLARALRLGESGDDQPPAEGVFARWSGAVTASLSCGGMLLMDAGVMQSLAHARSAVRARGGLVGIGAAMGSAPIDLRVELQGCDLALGALQSLRPGDVLRLSHRVDAPATIFDDRGHAVFRGWLARMRGRRAVELAALGPR